MVPKNRHLAQGVADQVKKGGVREYDVLFFVVCLIEIC